MEEKFMEWTKKDIERKTNSNRMGFHDKKNKIRHYEEDLGKGGRREDLVCKYCYYIRNSFGFSAMTTSYCGICKEPILNGSSDTNRVCEKCAGTIGLCVCCGGEMD